MPVETNDNATAFAVDIPCSSNATLANLLPLFVSCYDTAETYGTTESERRADCESISTASGTGTEGSAKRPCQHGAAAERVYKPEWRINWLMNFDEAANEMVCMLCSCRLKSLKIDTIKKHHDRKHARLTKKEYSDSRKKLLV